MPKIAIFPGSFDPVHNGHLAIAKLASQTHDEVFLVPSGVSPNKAHKIQTPGQMRGNWIHQCLKNPEISQNGKIRLSNFECNQNRRTYTLDTIRHFIREFPGATITLICGADTAAKIQRWPTAQTIHKLTTLLVISRDGIPGNVDSATWDVSSSQIQRKIKNCEPIANLVPAEILAQVLGNFGPKNTEEHIQNLWNTIQNTNPQQAGELSHELKLFAQERKVATAKAAELNRIIGELELPTPSTP